LSNEPRLSACLTFDFDALSVHLGTMRTTDPAALSRGEFGPFVLPRILGLLAQYDITATFFVPGHTALAYPDSVRMIRDAGHEIAHHGFVHENPSAMDEAEERRSFERGLEILDQVASVVPRGYRAPAGGLSQHSVEIFLEHGLVYDSTMSATDFTPYYVRQGDVATFDAPYQFGEHSNLVGIPFSWGLDDWPHLEFAPGWSTGQKPPSAVEEIWRTEFDYAYANVPGGVYDLTMHPQIIGRGSRLEMLRRLIEHMAAQPGVVFEPLITYAERWRDNNPLEVWRKQPSTHVRARHGGPVE